MTDLIRIAAHAFIGRDPRNMAARGWQRDGVTGATRPATAARKR